MKRAFSAGGIIFDDQKQVLICQPKDSKNWVFPKGTVDPGETSKQAAIREVKEETGVEAEIITKVGESKFYFTDKSKQKIFKVVFYFAMKYKSGNIKDHDREMQEVMWVSFDQAFEVLTFKNDTDLLTKALKIING